MYGRRSLVILKSRNACMEGGYRWLFSSLAMRLWTAIAGYSQVSKRVYGRRRSLVILMSRNASMDDDRRLFSSLEMHAWTVVGSGGEAVGFALDPRCVPRAAATHEVHSFIV